MAGRIYYPQQSACSLKDVVQSFCQNSDSPEDFANAVLRVNPRTVNLNGYMAPHRPVLIPDSAHVPRYHSMN